MEFENSKPCMGGGFVKTYFLEKSRTEGEVKLRKEIICRYGLVQVIDCYIGVFPKRQKAMYNKKLSQV